VELLFETAVSEISNPISEKVTVGLECFFLRGGLSELKTSLLKKRWRRFLRGFPRLQRMRFEIASHQTARRFQEEIEELRRKGDRNAIVSKQEELRLELDLLHEVQECYFTERLLKEARRYRVDVPARPRFTEDAGFEESEDWTHGPRYDLFLTAKGRHKVTELLRKEKK
jgi:hypothetical protein